MRSKLSWLVTSYLTVVLLLTVCDLARAADVDEEGIRSALAGFYSALNATFTGDQEP